MGLDKLLYLQGVGADFVNSLGERVEIAEQDRVAMLRCMLPAQWSKTDLSAEQIAQRIYQLDAEPWTQLLPPFQHTSTDKPTLSLFLRRCCTAILNIKVQFENGEVMQFSLDPTSLLNHPDLVQIVGDYRIGERVYYHYQIGFNQTLFESELVVSTSCNVLPYLGLGYHELHVEMVSDTQAVQSRKANGTWLVASSSCYPAGAARQPESQKHWGVSVQLFSLRSETQWGIGDFNDLTALIKWVAKEGGSFVQLNPLHALDLAQPAACSPYSPSDRRRLNPLYIHLEAVPEWADLCQRLDTAAFSALIDDVNAIKKKLNSNQWIDYTAVSQHKYHFFMLLYHEFIKNHLDNHSARGALFTQFVNERGEDLHAFCTQQVIDTADIEAFSGVDESFFAYLQFVAEQQLAQCQVNAKQWGMFIGLVRDLAVGAAANSVEIKSDNNPFCASASIGAPPDQFAPQGQNWGLLPFDPIALKRTGYQHFIALLRSNMQSCGALRIDHVMSLLRLWWWPSHHAQEGGCYVYYPLDALLAIVCTESQRAQCWVIGEDLGLIPPEIVGKLAAAGVLSNELFYFSKQQAHFTPPADYKAQSLMMLANHDVPTLRAWWHADDLQLRRKIGLIDDEHWLLLHGERAQDKQQLLTLLQQEGALQQATVNEVDYSALFHVLLAVTAAGQSALFSVQLCDLMMDVEPVNIPGTWLEYPNWQRRLSATLTELTTSAQRRGLLQLLQQSRQLTEADGASALAAKLAENINTSANIPTPASSASLSLQLNGSTRYD
ncbi:4-alpha-glucanotransferase [Shewanella sp.]|nr:4-alpha-glucanotransferase [Shewanella sp.]